LFCFRIYFIDSLVQITSLNALKCFEFVVKTCWLSLSSACRIQFGNIDPLEMNPSIVLNRFQSDLSYRMNRREIECIHPLSYFLIVKLLNFRYQKICPCNHESYLFQTKWSSLNWSWLRYNVLGDTTEQILQSVVRRYQEDGTQRMERHFQDHIVSIIMLSFTKMVICFPCLACKFGRLGCTI